MDRTLRVLVAGAAGLVLLLAACSSGGRATPPASGSPGGNKLEVVSWWTSGSERAALDVIFDNFTKSDPGVDIVNAAVVGGGGSNAQVVLANRLASNDPPDVWQTHPGGSLRAYYNAGLLADVSSVYQQDNLSSAVPKQMRAGVSVGGKEYGVSTGAHRVNVLWFNKKLLARAGVSPPVGDYTIEAFLTDLRRVHAAGIVPLCRGGKDPFATSELFENTLLSVVGAKGWTALAADDFRWDGAQVDQALNSFGTMLGYSDPEAAALTWDRATKKLAAGGCAFEGVNDSAYGELVKTGAKEGTDFGYVAFPGTDDAFLTVVDTFVIAANVRDRASAVTFLATIGGKETQLAFNKVKGSTPIRVDVDVSSLPPYQQAAAKAFRNGNVLLSITHGEATSPDFQRTFYDAVAAYADSKDAAAFHSALRDSDGQVQPFGH
ncbi:MAG TPA: ABC transporter substrate-binding protein [Kineosporiaceae bacterium]